jgi:hypothetical protein
MMPTPAQVRDFMDTIKYPRCAALSVYKLVVKFNLTYKEATVLWQNYWEEKNG